MTSHSSNSVDPAKLPSKLSSSAKTVKAPVVPRTNVKQMTGLPWETDQLPRQMFVGSQGEGFEDLYGRWVSDVCELSSSSRPFRKEIEANCTMLTFTAHLSASPKRRNQKVSLSSPLLPHLLSDPLPNDLPISATLRTAVHPSTRPLLLILVRVVTVCFLRSREVKHLRVGDRLRDLVKVMAMVMDRWVEVQEVRG